MKHHIIYVPGLGDHHSRGQSIVVRYWRIFGLYGHYLPLNWRDPESFSYKLKKLTDKIDELTEQGHNVSLVGVSAGASAVLSAYVSRPHINGAITIAGKIYRPETIGQTIQTENPDFAEAMGYVQNNLDILSQRSALKNILCIYSLGDKRVPFKDATIRNGNKYRVAGWNHGSGIFFGVIQGAPTIARFLKSRPD